MGKENTFPKNPIEQELSEEPMTLLTPRLRRVAVITAISAFSAVSLVLGNELLFLVTFSLALLLVLAKGFAHWTLRGLKLEVSGTPEAVEGQEALVTFRLVNQGILPRYLVEVRLKLPPGVEVVDPPHLVFGQLMPHAQEEATLRVHFKRRGLHSLGKALLWAQDPLGLFVVTRLVEAQNQVLVYPFPKPMPMEPEGASQQMHWESRGAQSPIPSVNGEEFWGVRPYQAGDPLRRIHWKITAHQGQLSIVQTMPFLREGGVILLDRHPAAHRPLSADGETTLDELVRYAAYLVREWVRHHWQVIFWAPPDPPLRVEGDWYPVWRQLALLEPALFSLSDLRQAGKGVVLTTPYSPMLSLYFRSPGWQVWVMPADELAPTGLREPFTLSKGRW